MVGSIDPEDSTPKNLRSLVKFKEETPAMKDFYKDLGHNYIKIFKNREVPEFAKNAHTLDKGEIAELPDSAFAHPESRSLPLVDKGNVFVSAAYYYGANEKNASVEERIISACKMLGIESEVSDLAKDLSEQAKIASEELPEAPPLASIQIKGNGYSVNHGGAEEFAQFFLEKIAGTLNSPEKIKTFKAVRELVESDGGVVPEGLRKRATDLEILADQVRARGVRVDDNKKALSLFKIANDIRESQGSTPEMLEKVAEILEATDKEFGLERFYGASLANPFLSVMNVDEEEDRNKNATIDLGERKITREQFEKINPRIFDAAFGHNLDKTAGENGGWTFEKVVALDTKSKTVLASYL